MVGNLVELSEGLSSLAVIEARKSRSLVTFRSFFTQMDVLALANSTVSVH